MTRTRWTCIQVVVRSNELKRYVLRMSQFNMVVYSFELARDLYISFQYRPRDLPPRQQSLAV